jgi:two-component system sensor histidine kinase/response regulator
VQTVAPAALARQVWEELDAQPEGRRVEFVAGDLPSCSADPALLKQVFANLLGNALKYSRGRESARIEVGFSEMAVPSPHSGVYWVRDNGAGFDMRYADKLFGVFQRLHSQAEYAGSGVGLAIAQRIIQRHCGRIWAEAKVDKGSTFYFTILDTIVASEARQCELMEEPRS